MSDDMPISAKYILDVMERVSKEGPSALYINDETLTDTIFDGEVDMVAVADILSERARAMVAAAYVEMAARFEPDDTPWQDKQTMRVMRFVRNTIRMLTPREDRAALDRLIAEAVEAEKEAICQEISEMPPTTLGGTNAGPDDHHLTWNYGGETMRRAVLAAIRARGEDKE